MTEDVLNIRHAGNKDRMIISNTENYETETVFKYLPRIHNVIQVFPSNTAIATSAPRKTQHPHGSESGNVCALAQQLLKKSRAAQIAKRESMDCVPFVKNQNEMRCAGVEMKDAALLMLGIEPRCLSAINDFDFNNSTLAIEPDMPRSVISYTPSFIDGSLKVNDWSRTVRATICRQS